jgi:hypothetical protein
MVSAAARTRSRRRGWAGAGDDGGWFADIPHVSEIAFELKKELR